ncbi:related to mitotic and DNA damage checkpoint protein hus1 [Cephalotrichum gorgonifer]|uniref:Checkpoint protein n=1 Tax=Cephalotrichum gorgonifer TaxID=2041049 RepID=A0AAE8MUV7_9PEZI|nr:related to mitotic and DNA damage checkpoint protein hus1 [Cephalotrichum gorgonifer]
MRFRAQLKNIGTFQSKLTPSLPQLTAALSSLEKIAWVRLDNHVARFTAIPDTGSHVWATFNMDVIFDEVSISSKEPDNAINLELPLAPLQRALKSALNSVSADMKLSKRASDGVPVLAMTISTLTNPTTAAANQPRGGAYGAGGAVDVDADDDDLTGYPIENLETSLRREREKVITHEIPIRVLYPESVETIMQPKTRDPDVNITFPPLLHLKALADRFTRLTAAGATSRSAAPKLELSANMFGSLRLSVRTDGGSVSSEWAGLVTPELNPEQMSLPVEEHPTTRFREAGPERWASVRVDGKDLSRVLSVGRLEGRVIGSFIDDHALILYCYISHFDEATVAEESVMTYYVQSYAQ